METNPPAILPPVDLKITESRASILYERIASAKINSIDTYILVGDLLKEVKNLIGNIDGAFESAVNQAYKTHKTILGLKRQAIERLEEAAKLAKDKLVYYYDAKGDVLPKIEGVVYSDHWTGEVEDARKLPREFLMPDVKKLEAVTKALKEATAIPGWKVVVEKIISVKSI